MVDDKDWCEWLNVSSGTGSPGQSQTKGCKTVIVLVVVVCQPMWLGLFMLAAFVD